MSVTVLIMQLKGFHLLLSGYISRCVGSMSDAYLQDNEVESLQDTRYGKV